MSDSLDGLKIALEAHKPVIAAQYSKTVANLLAKMIRELGPALKGVGNDWSWARVWRGTVALNTKRVDGSVVLDTERLAANAARYADAAIANWEDKIGQKLIDLADTKVEHIGGGDFRISGTRNSHAVVIIQTMIINVSKLGTPFNQFPARIYVNNRFTSESAYKRIAA